MKYYIKLTDSMFPLTEHQKNFLYSINLIQPDIGNVFQLTYDTELINIELALKGISND